MKHPYSKEQEYMDLSLTETIEPLPELSRPETAQVQEKSAAEAPAARSACENAGAAKPEQDIQPRVRHAKAPAARCPSVCRSDTAHQPQTRLPRRKKRRPKKMPLPPLRQARRPSAATRTHASS